MSLDLYEVKAKIREAFERFIAFIQNPWYNIRNLQMLTAEQLTAYILVLSVIPVVLNLFLNFGFWGFLGVITIPFRSLITVAMWLLMSYVIHMVVFREKQFEIIVVANLITFAGTFWFMGQVIPFLSPALGVLAYVLFCEAYAPKIKESRQKVYLAFGVGLLVTIAPLLIAFRS